MTHSTSTEEGVAATARWTAAVRAHESGLPDAIFTDPYAADLAGETGFRLLERYDNPGVKEFISIRTRYLDETAAAAPGQVVLLAAGLDTRTARLSWRPGAVVYEVDRPALLEAKEKELAVLGARHGCERRTVPADLTRDWPSALRGAGWDPGAPTVWIAEGLLCYLPEREARALVTAVAERAAPGDVFAGDLLSHQSLVSEFTQEGLGRLVEDGCPWVFGTDEPEEFLAGCGWEVAEVKCPGEPGASYGRWPWEPLPREVMGFPRNFLFTARRRSA
jgi:methyltransferase (TIGR00027 family)